MKRPARRPESCRKTEQRCHDNLPRILDPVRLLLIADHESQIVPILRRSTKAGTDSTGRAGHENGSPAIFRRRKRFLSKNIRIAHGRLLQQVSGTKTTLLTAAHTQKQTCQKKWTRHINPKLDDGAGSNAVGEEVAPYHRPTRKTSVPQKAVDGLPALTRAAAKAIARARAAGLEPVIRFADAETESKSKPSAE